MTLKNKTKQKAMYMLYKLKNKQAKKKPKTKKSIYKIPEKTTKDESGSTVWKQLSFFLYSL